MVDLLKEAEEEEKHNSTCRSVEKHVVTVSFFYFYFAFFPFSKGQTNFPCILTIVSSTEIKKETNSWRRPIMLNEPENFFFVKREGVSTNFTIPTRITYAKVTIITLRGLKKNSGSNLGI